MQSFPHHYRVSASGTEEGLLTMTSDGLPGLTAEGPAEFDGPGDQWSPETLLMSAAAACFVLSFRAVATASKLEWVALSCSAEGELDRIDKVTRFTKVTTHAELTVKNAADTSKAEKLLEKAESICLIANSLQAERVLLSSIHVASP